MQSLEILKQELITQKEILDSKGFPVEVKNTNPSPSEITKALQSITVDFTQTTAKESDVLEGKTFYSQNSELKTGTLNVSSEIDKYKNMVYGLLIGDRQMEIFIPDDCTQIRPYAYYCYSNSPYYKDNLTIPETVTKIGNAAFYGVTINGTLTIPSTCTTIQSEAFRKINVTEIIIGNGISSSSTWCFSDSPTVQKITVCNPITILPTNGIAYDKALLEIHLPDSLTEITAYGLYGNTGLKMVKFNGTVPPKVSSASFQSCLKAALVVPYLAYDAYVNATNYQKYGQPFIGFGNFELGDTLPSSIDGYTIVWYETLDDARAATNPVTLCPATGTMYAVLTAIT